MKINRETKIVLCVVGFIALFLLLASVVRGDLFAFQTENDLLDYEGTDRHYTHGTRGTYADHEPPQWSFLDDRFENYDSTASYAIGQLLYTPNNIRETELIEDDRPYAAWLYFGLGRQYAKYFDNGRAKQKFGELQLGVVGPWAQGEEAQTLVHELTDSAPPNGWDNQINNEVGINLILQAKDRFPVWDQYIDFTSHYGGALGNIMTFANVGGSFRLGPNLPQNFHISKFEPAPRVFGQSTLKRLGLDRSYAYCDFDGRLVLRNIFLDGNTFSDSHSVDKNYLVGDVEAGVSLSLWKVDFMMGYVFRSKEFEIQEKSNKFASVRIIFNF